MSKVYHTQNVTYIIKLKDFNLYAKNFDTYTSKLADAMNFRSENPASEKTWSEIFDKDLHTVIKRTERISNTYEEVVLDV